MKKENIQSRFPLSLFGIYLGVILLMSGIHTGLIVLMRTLGWNDAVETIVAVIYWGMTALLLTMYTRKRIRETYDEPLQRLAEAAQAVAKGDFSVYMPTIHSSDQIDYLDEMILDFNKMVEALGSIETLKTDFVSNVSHEMKTPIAVIKNSAELLRIENPSGKDTAEYAQNIIDESDRLSKLVTDILRLNKLENQTILPEVSTYDLCRQLTECILQFDSILDEKELELEADMEDSFLITADKSLLELVWNNLLSNAVKFSDKNGTVSVREHSDGEIVTVTVSDTGCGMDEKTQEHIFEKFYQGDTSHSAEGNGLGMALACRVIGLSGGTISVKSTLGQGSSFTVRLPKGIRAND